VSHRYVLIAGFLLLLVACCACAGSEPTAVPPAPTAVGSPTNAAVSTSTPKPTATPWPPLSGSGGGLIAFVSDRSGNQDVWIMNADGSDPRQLTTNSAQDGWPAWSPDGTRLAFQSRRGGAFNIFVAAVLGGSQVDDGAVQKLTSSLPGRDSWEPAWSPDGRQLAYSAAQASGSDLFVMNADGTGKQRLTEDKAIDGGPAWSPDGRQIAFLTSRDGDWEIYVMEADGSNVRRLTNQAGQDHSPSWSPDGARIAFVSDRDGNEEIYVMAADGANPQRLTNSEAEEWFPAWSPDGKRIAFSSSRDGNQEIYVMNADGSDPTRLTDDSAEDFGPIWLPVTRSGG